jgi:DNA-binding NarL/FixJ family response regulator
VRGAADLAEQIGLPLAVAYSDVASAYVALELGDYGEAVSLALGAVATFDSLDDVYSATTTRALAGRALAADGRRDDAARELARAAAIFESWGALRYRDEAERELRKLGRRLHRRTAPGEGDGLGSLTKRELEVATLVSHGKSNPEIAAELFLSHKTVESHIRNIFRKLDVSSRIHVALAVDRASLEEAEPIDG